MGEWPFIKRVGALDMVPLHTANEKLAEAEARLKDEQKQKMAILADWAQLSNIRKTLALELHDAVSHNTDLEARLAVEAGRIAEMQRCREKLGRERDEFEARIASLELELMRMTNDVDHRVADLEARLAADGIIIQNFRNLVEMKNKHIAALEAMWPSVKCQSCPDAKVMREARK